MSHIQESRGDTGGSNLQTQLRAEKTTQGWRETMKPRYRYSFSFTFMVKKYECKIVTV